MKPGRDILSGYGPDHRSPQRGPAECGGVLPGDQRDVRNYSPPQGPRNIMNTGVGLRGGTNHGNGQRPIAPGGHSGRAGLGGMNKGNDGTQR